MKTTEPSTKHVETQPAAGHTTKSGLGVMQLTDTLTAAGYERVAVNLANDLPANRYRSYLCTTRRDGPLEELIAPHVGRLRLQRAHRFDLGAVLRLVSYIRKNQIQILHAHGTTVFMSILASRFQPHPAVIWHNHAGRLTADEHPKLRWRLAARRIDGTIVVSQLLQQWCVRNLGMPPDRTWYVRNYVHMPDHVEPASSLPGQPNFRIVSVANLLPDKDPLNLLRAMKIVARESPSAHLLMVGRSGDSAYMEKVRAEMADAVLQGRVSMLGVRSDVASIMKGCDIGVLASATEGLPLTLLEYGMAGLPVVTTRVGQCEEVLNGGRLGLLVPPSAPDELAQAILSLLASPARRAELGNRFQQHVQENYSRDQVLQQIGEVYATVLASRTNVAGAGASRR